MENFKMEVTFIGNENENENQDENEGLGIRCGGPVDYFILVGDCFLLFY